MVQLADIDMDQRLQILHEEEFRSNQHKEFQHKLSQRMSQLPRFLQKQQMSQVREDILEDAEKFQKSLVSDQLDKDSDENPSNAQEAEEEVKEVPKEEKS